MARKLVNFRLSPEALAVLDMYSMPGLLSRTAVVERALELYHTNKNVADKPDLHGNNADLQRKNVVIHNNRVKKMWWQRVLVHVSAKAPSMDFWPLLGAAWDAFTVGVVSWIQRWGRLP